MKNKNENRLILSARKIASELIAFNESPFDEFDIISGEWEQDDFYYMEYEWFWAPDTWALIYNLPKKYNLWYFVETSLSTSATQNKTIWAYVSALVDVVWLGLAKELAPDFIPKRSRAAKLKVYSIVLALPADVITLELAEDYLTGRMAVAEKILIELGDEERAKSIIRTSTGKLNQARQFFLGRHGAVHAYLGRKLPVGASDFCAATGLDIERKNYAAPSEYQFIHLLRIITELENSDFPTYVFFVLVIWAGLRAKEAMHARVSWVLDSTTFPIIDVRNECDMITKSGRPRKVRILPHVSIILQSISGEYLVSDLKSERLRAYQNAINILKEIKIPDKKPVHYMRRIFYTATTKQCGAEEARRSAGHVSFGVGMNSYTFKEFGSELLRLWLAGPHGLYKAAPHVSCV